MVNIELYFRIDFKIIQFFSVSIMAKLTKIIFFSLFIGVFLIEAVSAQMVELKKEKNRVKQELKIAAFLDYPPFGHYADPPYKDSFTSIFQPVIAQYAEKQNFEVNYVITKNYATLVRDVRRGEIDMLLGMYHETDMYMGLEYIFPAAVNNPIVAIMLPNRINEVKSRSALKKLQGAMSTHEHISDYVAQELKQYNIKRFDKTLDMYELLFAGKVDYIIGSRYYNMIEAMRLGVYNKVSFSKQSIWDMPLFIGISKTSPHKKFLIKTFEATMQNPETVKKIEQTLIDTINQIQQETKGVVPPSFSSDKKLPDINETAVIEQPNTMIMVTPPGKRQ